MLTNRHWSLLLAGFCLVGAALAFLAYTYINDQHLRDNGDSRAIVLEQLADAIPYAVEGTADSNLKNAVESLARHKLVSAVWVVDINGKITYHQGGRGSVGDDIESLSNPKDLTLVRSLQPGLLSPEQELQVLTVAALRAAKRDSSQGYYVISLKDTQGQLAGVVTVSYIISSAAGITTVVRNLLPTFGVLLFITYWLAIVYWVYQDAQLKGENALLWAGLALMTNIVGLTAYSLVVDNGGERMLNYVKWLDDKMWHVALALPISLWAHPNHYSYNIRLAKYTTQRSEIIREIKMMRRRYDPDTVNVYLMNYVDQQECRVIAEEISPLMDNGWLDIKFFFQKEVVAHYLLMNGKDYVPSVTRTKHNQL